MQKLPISVYPKEGGKSKKELFPIQLLLRKGYGHGINGSTTNEF